LQKIKLIK